MKNKNILIGSGITILSILLLFLLGVLFGQIEAATLPTYAPFKQVIIMPIIILIVLSINNLLSSELENHKKLIFISAITIIGFISAVLFCCYQGYYLHNGYPFNTILFTRKQIFTDFTIIYNLYGNPDNMQLSFVPAFFLVPKIYMFWEHDLARKIWIASSLILFIIYNFINYYSVFKDKFIKFVKTKAFIFSLIFLCSYPFLFGIDRGNFELTLLFILALFIWLYQKKRYMLAGIVLSLAIDMKFFPFFFLLLFLSDRKYKAFFFTIFVLIITNLLCLKAYSGDYLYNLFHFFINDNNYTEQMVMKHGGFEYGASLYGVFKYFLNVKFNILPIETLMKVYEIFAGSMIVLISLYVWFIEKTFWKKVAIITIMRLLFVFISAYYTLILLLIPVYLFCQHKQQDKNDWFYTSAFGLLMIPYNYLLIYHENTWYNICPDAGILIFPLIMLYIMVKIISDGIKQYLTEKAKQ